jgi:hypothetical protein
MNDHAQYYSDIREQRDKLQQQFPAGDCLVISVRPLNNGACEVPLALAAKLLVEGSHRLASETECNSFRAAQEANRATTSPVDSLANARAQFAALMAAKGGRK